jgi:hypothetical protein
MMQVKNENIIYPILIRTNYRSHANQERNDKKGRGLILNSRLRASHRNSSYDLQVIYVNMECNDLNK